MMGNEVVKALLWKSIQTQEGFREELFFAASFGVGGYNAFTCIDFAGEGFTLVCFMYKTL